MPTNKTSPTCPDCFQPIDNSTQRCGCEIWPKRTSETMMLALIEKVAIAIHRASAPWTDWKELPDEDTAFGTGKVQRTSQAKAAINVLCTELLHDAGR